MAVNYTNLISRPPETESSPLFQGNIQNVPVSTNNACFTSSIVNNSDSIGLIPRNEVKQFGDKLPKKKNALKKENFRQSMQSFTDSHQNTQPVPMSPQGVVSNITGLNLVQPIQSPRNGVTVSNSHLHYRQAPPLLQIVRPTVQIFPNVQLHNVGRNIQPINISNKSPGSPQYLNNLMQHPLLGFRNISPTSPIAQNNVNNATLAYPQSPHLFQNQVNQVKKPNTKFKPYMSSAEVEEGLRTNKLFMGAFRINPKNSFNSYITINQTDQDILIEGYENRNRALDGDIVIIQMLDDHEIKASKESNKDLNKKRGERKKQMKKKDTKIKTHENNEMPTPRLVGNINEEEKSNELKINTLQEQSKHFDNSEKDLGKNNETQIDCNISPTTDKKQSNDNQKEHNLEQHFINELKITDGFQDKSLQFQKNINHEADVTKKTSKKLHNDVMITKEHKEGNFKLNSETISTLHKNKRKIKKNIKEIQNDKTENKNKPFEESVILENCAENFKSKLQQNQEPNKKSDEGNESEYYSEVLPKENNPTPDEHSERKLKRGKVVYIKEKIHSRISVGFLRLMPDKNKTVASLQPRDPRVPLINIPCTFWPDNFYKMHEEYANTLFVAKILDWNDVRYATGIIVSMIGSSGDLKTEQTAILAQNGLDVTPFDPALKIFYPPIHYEIPPQEINLREDCRKLCLFAIDPYNCRDIDDTVSCRELKNGNYEIGVHISDVSYYLMENTPLDEKVSKRATTVYMVEKAFHMLPDDLCLLCSLFPGKDKLAFSVFWEITKDAKILGHRFAKTVIQSCAQLSYEHAQDILDGKNIENDFPTTYNGFKYKDICKNIQILGSIAATLRKNRFDGGALKIDQLKIYLKLNPSGLPEGYILYQNKESHQLIEEFMLLANCTVAQKIYNDFPKMAFLRCHEPPNPQMMRDLDQTFKDLGIEFDITSAGDIYRSLLKCTENKDIAIVEVLTRLCAKPMSRAKYFCAASPPADGMEHYALNVPLYTHFTSPIRRYADIMVHRLMSASLKFRDTPNWDLKKIKSIAAKCNLNKQNSKVASEMSTDVYLMKYINMNSPMVMDAIVAEIKSSNIEVIIPDIALTKRVFFHKDFPASYKYMKNSKNFRLSKMEITWKKTDDLPELVQTLEMFTYVKIHMTKGDDLIKVDFSILRPEQ